MQKAALDAEKRIKEVYQTAFAVEIKSDDSPVTAADKGADELIRQELHRSFPDYALLTEESKDDPSRLLNANVFIVDPVDGTKEFVARNGEFTTNIALAHNHEVVVGVINVPVRNVMYFAIKGQGAYKQEKGKAPIRIHGTFFLMDLARILVLPKLALIYPTTYLYESPDAKKNRHLKKEGLALSNHVAFADAAMLPRVYPFRRIRMVVGDIVYRNNGKLMRPILTESARKRQDLVRAKLAERSRPRALLGLRDELRAQARETEAQLAAVLPPEKMTAVRAYLDERRQEARARLAAARRGG